MVKTAVILGAGLGSRLKDRTTDIPKGFITIGNKPLIEQSVSKLLKAGIEKILIGTGHASNYYDKLAQNYPGTVSCVRNERYRETGSMYTLYNMKDYIDADFLLLESDLLYDQVGLTVLQEMKNPDVVLASGRTNSKDEVFIETNPKGNLIKMSKDSNELKNIFGELVGITKISYSTFHKMCRFAQEKFIDKPKLDYEYALVGVTVSTSILVKKIEDYIWCEIDDETHLRRAENVIFPRLKEQI
ncbi:MAG: phosphocholine cytidylyltransferase family protein [Firmicutes bacterium]|nr:phosphocholine cytidylyltransferase family protein [Bacillota bacterium]